MYIYNTTTLVDPAIMDEWVSWMKDRQIPAIMATGFFERYQFVRLLDVDESHGRTFALQLYATDRAACDHFATQAEPALQRESQQQWGEKSLSFGTLMEVVH